MSLPPCPAYGWSQSSFLTLSCCSDEFLKRSHVEALTTKTCFLIDPTKWDVGGNGPKPTCLPYPKKLYNEEALS
jgi:hypothetical protein